MKTRTTRGRKRFSAGKHLSPDNSLDRNIDLAAMGEVATNPELRDAFNIVALWQKAHTRLPNDDATRARLRERTHEEKLLRLLNENLSRITPALGKVVFSAVARLDPEPFRSIANVIEIAKQVNESGAFQTQAVRAALLLQEQGIDGRASLLVTTAEFAAAYKARFGGNVNPDFLRRVCKQVGIFFKPAKTGRRRKTATLHPNSVR